VLFLARDDEPLDPCFVQYPQSISLDEGSIAKFDCKLSGSTPMTGMNTLLIVIESAHWVLLT
jgi:hypothetical protein